MNYSLLDGYGAPARLHMGNPLFPFVKPPITVGALQLFRLAGSFNGVQILRVFNPPDSGLGYMMSLGGLSSLTGRSMHRVTRKVPTRLP